MFNHVPFRPSFSSSLFPQWKGSLIHNVLPNLWKTAVIFGLLKNTRVPVPSWPTEEESLLSCFSQPHLWLPGTVLGTLDLPFLHAWASSHLWKVLPSSGRVQVIAPFPGRVPVPAPLCPPPTQPLPVEAGAALPGCGCVNPGHFWALHLGLSSATCCSECAQQSACVEGLLCLKRPAGGHGQRRVIRCGSSSSVPWASRVLPVTVPRAQPTRWQLEGSQWAYWQVWRGGADTQLGGCAWDGREHEWELRGELGAGLGKMDESYLSSTVDVVRELSRWRLRSFIFLSKLVIEVCVHKRSVLFLSEQLDTFSQSSCPFLDFT